MRSIQTLCAAILLIAGCVACGPKDILSIEGGKVQGVPSVQSGVTVFKGIPYAAAPVGELRWKRPQPVTPWEGVMVADHFGKASVQRGRQEGSFYYKEFQLTGPFETSEDCLYLNVWAPSEYIGNKNAKLPVAMWIHGGAYMGGCGHDDAFDGDAWAKRGVIMVTINYRLGALGFFSHEGLSAEEPDHSSGNYGTYDQVQALKWIYENIAQFGGDPSNITVMGQSAGAASVKNLVASPLAKNMINRAIIQSGGGLGKFIETQNDANRLDAEGKRIMDEAGLTSTKAMREAPLEEISKILSNLPMGGSSPHNDPTLIPESFDQATYKSHLADIEYMIGCNGDDMGDMRAGIEKFASVRDSLGHKPVYTYYFDRKLPGDDAGAFHSAELWYMFNTLSRSWRPFTEADYKLSEKMTDYWTNFCKYGNPNGENTDGEWKPSTHDSPYMQLLDI